MKKVYFMITDGGGGHRTVATSLKDVLQRQFLEWDIEIISVYKDVIKINSDDLYNDVILKNNFIAAIWPIIAPFGVYLMKFNHKKLVRVLTEFFRTNKPDIVISFMPYLNPAIKDGLEQVGYHTPFTVIVTDMSHAAKGYWFTKEPDYFICPTEYAINQAIKVGVDRKRILKVSGIPISQYFYKNSIVLDRISELLSLSLDGIKKTALISFGVICSIEVMEILKSIKNFRDKLQVIVLCGHNEDLYQSLSRYQSSVTVHPVRFTKNMFYYMSLCDFFIGKPGPTSLSEAIFMKLPVITVLNHKTMIQERYNTKWIIENRFGIVVSSFSKIERAVDYLLNENNLQKYKENLSKYKNDSIFEICNIMGEIYRNEK